MKKLLIASILLWTSVTAIAQPVDTTANRIRVRTAPSGACTAGQVAQTAAGEIYSCISGTWGLSGSVSITDATATVKGKAVLGQTAVVATASLGTCAAGNVGQIKRVTDGNKGTRVCTNTTGSTYAWVDPDPIVRPENFGWATGATAANNATYLQAAVDAAIAGGYGVVELPAGTFEWSTSITFSASNLIIRGQGQATVLRFSGSGPAFRNSDWTSVKSFLQFKDFWLYAYGSAINDASSIGIDLSSCTDSIVDNVYLYNFGTGILLDGHRPDTATAYSTYYNKIINSFVGATSDGYTNCVKGISIVNEANSNIIDNLKTSRYTNPISIGDGSYSPPNQIEIINPMIEAHLGAAINIVKGFGIHVSNGRFEGVHKAFQIANTLASVIGVNIIHPFFQISGSETVVDTSNPTVCLKGGNLSNFRSSCAGLGSSTINLVPNGNMEGWGNSGTSTLLGWIGVNGTTWSGTTTAAAIRTTSPLKSGTYSLAITNTLSLGVASQLFPVVENIPYTFSYYSAATSTSNGHRFAFRFFDSAGSQITSGWTDPTYYGIGDNYESGSGGLTYSGSYNAWIGGSNLTHTSTNTYVRRAGIFTPPTGAVSMQIALIVTVATGFPAFDEVQVIQGAALWQAIDKPLNSGGAQTLYGNLTTARYITADSSAGAGSLEISVQGGESRIRELNAGRIYYDGYNHVFRDSSGTEFGRIDQNGTFYFTDVGIKRNASGILEINSGTGGTFRDLYARSINLTSTSANAFAVGANGTTNPALKVDASAASVATGISVTGAAAGSGVAVAAISSGSNENLTLAGKGTGAVRFLSPLNFTSLAFSTTAPTVTSAGTSPSIPANNGTAAFTVNVGTGGTATTIVLAMPTAANGWICHATNITATAANRADQAVRLTASTTTSVTLQNQTVSTGAALAFTASDVVHCQCTAY